MSTTENAGQKSGTIDWFRRCYTSTPENAGQKSGTIDWFWRCYTSTPENAGQKSFTIDCLDDITPEFQEEPFKKAGQLTCPKGATSLL